MFFKENLKYLTKNTEINQNRLASILGISRQSITSLLNTDNPRANTLIKISQIYNVSIDDLLNKDLSKENN